MKARAILFVILGLLTVVCTTPVYANGVPPLPHAFYGDLNINDSPAPTGTIVEARGEGVTTGIEGNPIVTTEVGKYGSADPLGIKLIVQGDILEGATLTFYINGVSTEQTAEWHSGYTTALDLSVTIAAPPLIAEAGGPYSGKRGANITLSGSAEGGTAPYAYAWDLDNDGEYDDATGATPSHSWASADTYTIGLQVTDNASATATDTATVTVTKPAGGVSGPSTYYLETDLFGTKARVRIESDGEIQVKITATSADSLLTITVTKGTIALDKDGDRLDSLEAAVDESPPDPPEDAHFIGLAYEFDPDGATFDPPISFIWNYDPDALPEGVAEDDLVVAYYDENDDEWVESDFVLDTENDVITASVEHFTTFAVLAYARAAFTASDLSIAPAEVGVGEEVTISVMVANTGDLSGTYELILRIDDAVVATEDVTLDAGASETVTFTTSQDVPGTYAVTVDDLSGTFAVQGAAAFAASELSITPAEVEAGEELTITVVVTNTGDLAGSYKVSLEVDGVEVDTRLITLDGGASVTVPFTTSQDVAGTYSVKVDGLSGTFEVKPVVVEKPAAFTVSQLSISPAEVEVGETVSISVMVANTGDLSGSYEVTLKIDGVAVATKDVTLGGGASQKVTFTTSQDVAGTYSVGVDGQQRTLVVKERPQPVNWPVIGGIIAGVIVVGLIIFFIVRRRVA